MNALKQKTYTLVPEGGAKTLADAAVGAGAPSPNGAAPADATSSAPSPGNAAASFPDAPSANAPARQPHIAVVTMGVKLGDETRGYTRFRFLSELLVRKGFRVTLITSSFQHWDKAQRDIKRGCYQGLPYEISFIHEPGYHRNLDLGRIRSHAVAARNLAEHFRQYSGYDLVYAEIPPNDVARVCAEWARDAGVPFVADINDLWPEAMRMVVNVPIVSDIAFYPFTRDAKQVYQLLSGAVGTSDEYAARPAADRDKPYRRVTAYVGNDLAVFDKGSAAHAGEVEKPEGEFWVIYAGTLGASYDLATLIKASCDFGEDVRVKILGDGPDAASLRELAAKLNAPVDFLGYMPYDLMAAYLCASSVTVNSLVRTAAQSIVTKIGDYLAAGVPIINTGASAEMRALVETNNIGINVEAENTALLVDAVRQLHDNPAMCRSMGTRARKLAEERFDRESAYQPIVDLIRELLEEGTH